jgi:hypothetical protein
MLILVESAGRCRESRQAWFPHRLSYIASVLDAVTAHIALDVLPAAS